MTNEEKIKECNRMILHFCKRKDLQMASFWQKIRGVYEKRHAEENLPPDIDVMDTIIGIARRRRL